MKTLIVLLHIGAGHGGNFGFILFLGIILIIVASTNKKEAPKRKPNPLTNNNNK